MLREDTNATGLEIELSGDVAIARLCHGDLNLLNGGLFDALERCATLHSIKALILTGEGRRAFCGGRDRVAEMGTAARSMDTRRRAQQLETLADAPFVLIAAINGAALGAGLELCLCADLIYAAPHAVFGLPAINQGGIPSHGGIQRLSRLVGPLRARELIYTGQVIDATEALRIGLVARVFEREELIPQSQRIAATIASNRRAALRAAKRALIEGATLPLRDALRLERELVTDLEEGEY